MSDSLYASWERTRDEAGSDRWALSDLRRGRRWTFGEIQAEVDALPELETGGVFFPTGFSTDLIFQTLRVWRDQAILCPIEKEDDLPEVKALSGLPPAIVHVKLTSGSTAGPRLVLFDAEALAADPRKIVSTMGLRSKWPNLGVISMAHSYGFSSLVLPLLLQGIPLAWLGDPLPGSVADALGNDPPEGEGWTLPAVPAMRRAWHAGGVLNGGRVKLAISAGAPLPVQLERVIHAETGLKVHNFYGSSECGGIAYDRSESPRESEDSVGTAMDETGLLVNEQGCLEVRGESVAQGYWPEESNLGKGVFVTSDLASIDESGEVRLGGRRDDMINVAGRKVSPGRIEDVLNQVPGVRCGLVFGIPSADAARGDEVVAAVNLEIDHSDELERVRKAIGNQLATHEWPRHWWSCPDLLPDVRGKLSRSAWRKRFLESRSQSIGS